MISFKLRWRYFWSRRNRGRMLLALICSLLALCAAIFLALPAGAQATVLQESRQVMAFVDLVGLNVIVEVGLVVFTIVSVALLLTPDYHAYTYLVPPSAEIPSVSVYLDAESEPPTAAIPGFVNHLRKYLDGRRADLLFFTEAQTAAGKPRYVELARYGFRPIDVPHDPTGVGFVKEAVDRELAMHAFERALLGPAHQEFIIVTKDGDYVPLVYRLCALGHKVQVWSTQHSPPYTQLALYLDVKVVNLSPELASQAPVASSAALAPAKAPPKSWQARKAQRKWARHKRGKTSAARFDVDALRVSIPAIISVTPGADKLFRAIEVTRLANDWYRNRFRADASRYGEFRKQALTGLVPDIAAVGYSVGSWLDFWIEHLTALRVFLPEQPNRSLARGPTTTELAALQLRAMAQVAAEAATMAESTRGDGLIHIRAISIIMESREFHDAETGGLGALVAPSEVRRTLHTRYFVWCARAVGLLHFDDVKGTVDLLRSPRLSNPVAPDVISGASEPPNAPNQSEAPQPGDASGSDAGRAQAGDEPPTPPSLA